MTTPSRPTSKSGMGMLGQSSTDRNIGSVQAASPTMIGAELTTEIYTFITKATSNGQPPVLYNGDRQYADVILTLETDGPVAVSNKQQGLSVQSGQGQLLEKGVPLRYTIAKGNRIWVAAEGANRIKVTVQPFPWLEQITGLLGQISSFLSRGTSR